MHVAAPVRLRLGSRSISTPSPSLASPPCPLALLTRRHARRSKASFVAADQSNRLFTANTCNLQVTYVHLCSSLPLMAELDLSCSATGLNCEATKPVIQQERCCRAVPVFLLLFLLLPLLLRRGFITQKIRRAPRAPSPCPSATFNKFLNISMHTAATSTEKIYELFSSMKKKEEIWRGGVKGG